MEEKFVTAADEKKKISSALLTWGEIYCLGDLDKFHKAPRINKTFSLLSKSISSSRYVSLSLDDSAKLETCMCGQMSSCCYF